MDKQSSSMPSQIINDFEAAYRNGDVPRLQDFLGPEISMQPDLVRELIRLDLGYRRQRGLPIEVGHYLAALPSLAEQEDLLVQVIEAEHKQRQERGEASLLEEHAARFPVVAKWLSEGLLASTVDFTADSMATASMATASTAMSCSGSGSASRSWRRGTDTRRIPTRTPTLTTATRTATRILPGTTRRTGTGDIAATTRLVARRWAGRPGMLRA